MQDINLITIFLTGLFTGGLTCLAVQGGLLATTIAQREEQKLSKKAKSSGNVLPILSFLASKLAAYTILGFLLGALGSVVQMSLQATVVIQFAVAIFMLGTALNILNVHPIFRYFVVQPPRFLTRMVRKQSKRADLFAPALLGLFTVFIPCGTTQAMMALAVGSGSPILGAMILFIFVLGTSPLFFGLGYSAAKLGDAFHKKFMTVAAVLLLLLGMYNLMGAVALTGYDFGVDATSQQAGQAATSEPTINIQETGYSPTSITVKAASTVKLHLNNAGANGCAQAFTIPKLGIQKLVPPGKSETITFQAPKEKGGITFMCSMGMYKGIMNVI